jgi:hypothetical protein
MGLILFIVAVALAILLSLPGLVHTIAGAIRWKGKYRYVDNAFSKGAEAIDVFGNMAFASFLNDWFLRKGGYHYGQGRETISSATGKNWVVGKLTFWGLGLAGFLNLVDKDHCWKYIEGNRTGYDLIGKPDPVKWYCTASFMVVATVGLYGLGKLTFWICS